MVATTAIYIEKLITNDKETETNVIGRKKEDIIIWVGMTSIFHRGISH